MVRFLRGCKIVALIVATILGLLLLIPLLTRNNVKYSPYAITYDYNEHTTKYGFLKVTDPSQAVVYRDLLYKEGVI